MFSNWKLILVGKHWKNYEKKLLVLDLDETLIFSVKERLNSVRFCLS